MDTREMVFLGIVALVACVALMLHEEEAEPPRPGSLVLTMFTRGDEEDLAHMARGLPQWAKVVDAYVIGVQDRGDSEAVQRVVEASMGDLPGVLVDGIEFRGLGRAWTPLVEAGLEYFPWCEHGVLARPAHHPLKPHAFSRHSLHPGFSSHYFTLVSEDGEHEVSVEWVYRNVAGVRVRGAVNMFLEVAPGQRGALPLDVVDAQSRRGRDFYGVPWASLAYYELLVDEAREHTPSFESELELANTLYMLLNGGVVHGGGGGEVERVARMACARYEAALELAAGVEGSTGVLWAMLRRAEVSVRFLADDAAAHSWYHRAHRYLPDNVDAMFFLARFLRMGGKFRKSMRLYRRVVSAHVRGAVPTHSSRDLIDTCLVYLETIFAAQQPSVVLEEGDAELLRVAHARARANCMQDGDRRQLAAAWPLVEAKLARGDAPHTPTSTHHAHAAAARGHGDEPGTVVADFVDFVLSFVTDMQDELTNVIVTSVQADGHSGFEQRDLFTPLASHVATLDELVERHGDTPPCRALAAPLHAYLAFFAEHGSNWKGIVGDAATMDAWTAHNAALRALCAPAA